MRRPEVTSWWFVLVLWSVLLPLAVGALSTYLRDGVNTYLCAFLTHLVLLVGLPVMRFLPPSRNPRERVTWVSTLTVYLATTVPIFFSASLTLAVTAGELWWLGAPPAHKMIMYGAVLLFFVALVLRTLEFSYVRDPEYQI